MKKLYAIGISTTYPDGRVFHSCTQKWAESADAAHAKALEDELPIWDRWGDLPGSDVSFVPLAYASLWF